MRRALALRGAAAAASRAGREALLFTPGPLTTSAPTKAAMLRDLGTVASKIA